MADPVGVIEAAERLGLSRKTVWAWRDKGIFPPPDYPSVNSGAAWEWRTVLQWAGESGRLHNDEVVAEYRRRFKRKPRSSRLGGVIPPDVRAINDRIRSGASV